MLRMAAITSVSRRVERPIVVTSESLHTMWQTLIRQYANMDSVTDDISQQDRR